MRADLREKLAVVWGKHEKTGVTPVTGVTRGTSQVITHATENVTVVTATPVTPQDANGYGGYEGYASKIAIASEVQEQSELTVAKSRVTGVGTNPRAVPCPTDIVERAAIIAEGDGCSRAEADRRALSRARPAIVAGPRGATPGRDHSRLSNGCRKDAPLREPTCSMRRGSLWLPRASTKAIAARLEP